MTAIKLYTGILLCVSLQLKVQCLHKGKRPPCSMHRGSVATDGTPAYFTSHDSTSLYKYQFDTEQWTELVSCHYQNSGLFILKDQEPTAVGGQDASLPTNKLLTMRQNKLWCEIYPRMTAATLCGELVIIGGEFGESSANFIHQIVGHKWVEIGCLSIGGGGVW